MSDICPQCGAALRAGERCRERFDVAQARELEDPAYGAVHHLSVPCYMLQHNAYSRDGWLYSRALLARFVEGLSPDAARRQHRRDVDSGRRAWSITKGDKLAGVDGIAWTRTIADVRLDTPEHYCADVRAWAASVLADTADLARAAGGEGDLGTDTGR
ncbi:MAG TPA: DUF5946 family protein [Thermomicrobiales bacterium]|nr:DUF5946 family protein [Thermomicrobiales bacterium]